MSEVFVGVAGITILYTYTLTVLSKRPCSEFQVLSCTSDHPDLHKFLSTPEHGIAVCSRNVVV